MKCTAVVLALVLNLTQRSKAFVTPSSSFGTVSRHFQKTTASTAGTVPATVPGTPSTPSFSYAYPSSDSSSIALLAKPILSEDDLATPPNQKVIEQVERMNGANVLASDVSSKTGLSLSETRKSLSSLASLTRGDISVTDDGELLYTFPSGIQNVLRSNSLRYKVQNTWSKNVWPKLFYGIRISFGVFLFISIAAIFSTLIFIQSGGGSSDDDDRRDDRRSGGGGMFRYGMGDFLFDLFYPRPYLYSPYYGYYGRYDPYYIQTANAEGGYQQEEEDRRGIFEGIFSYIFGDGDPNRNLEAARLREASRVIRNNGGSVTAEQLAPFCDVDDPDEMGNRFLVEEGFVLPVVSQLGGEPVVTDDGDIVYVFPDLQVSTLDDNELNADAVSAGRREMEWLDEQTVEFNVNEPWMNVAAGVLGVVNLGGAVYLGQALSSPALAGVKLAGVFGLVQTGFPLLVVYAILFNVIPAARYFSNKKLNGEISKRNSARRKYLTYLQVGGEAVSRKLSAARSLRKKMKRLVSGEGTVYDTRTKIEDLTSEREKMDMKKFDQLLGDDNDSSFQ